MTDQKPQVTTEPTEQSVEIVSKRPYESPQLEDYGSVNIRTQLGLGYGADGGSGYYTYGASSY